MIPTASAGDPAKWCETGVMSDPVPIVRFRALALSALARPACPFPELPPRLLVVDVARQRMGLINNGQLLSDISISTAANGIGGVQDSFRTPPGWHRVHSRIGADEPGGRVFRGRLATEDLWRGEARNEDLILTRVLTLDGLEEGLNRGPGCDSLARFIYLHGTNQEHLLGRPCSHGCIRLSNADIVALFDLVQEGDPLVVVDGEPPPGRLHFAGIAGSGMSALAQFLALQGGRVSGSDRSFDRGLFPASRARLEALGIRILPQDGSGLTADCLGLVHSTAVEETVPDFAEARRLNIPLIHRSELLAHLVATHRAIAITGTSGKSTTTAMVFELLRGAGLDPSVITGGDLRALQAQGLWGNAWAASSLLVVEADESDGSVVRYAPAVGVVLNLQLDHKPEAEVAELFRTFLGQTRETRVVGEDRGLRALAPGARTFGFAEGADLRATEVELAADHSTFRVGDVAFHLPLPGRHNVANALAALAACRAVDVELGDLVAPLAAFQGVSRRFQVLGESRGVTVVDDFGHNPAKVAASLAAAHLRPGRVLAVFQPHGYGPLRFLRAAFVEAFVTALAPGDRLWMLEVFYAGGSAARDISSTDVVADIAASGAQAAFAPSREWLVECLAAEARPGDLILVMGARDPSLTELARSILEALRQLSGHDGQARGTRALQQLPKG
jgi:UDP-N-acetylmuramate--L-alanine ligase